MSELQLAGIIPFSATDWPGKLTASAFVQGCPWRCVYCHNWQLQPFRAEWLGVAGSAGGDGDARRDGGAAGVGVGTRDAGSASAPSFADLLELMRSRRGLLDGVVISGGEPTAQRALGSAIGALHAEGFPVGLHTCGYLPARLEALLADPATRPEWIGLDVKGLPEDMPEVVGCSLVTAQEAWRSLEIAAAAAQRGEIDLEVRTTIWPGGVLEKHLPAVTARVKALGFDLVVHQAHDVDENGHYIAEK